jgi:hypothetical protein
VAGLSLRDPAVDVGAVWVVAVLLQCWVEDPPGDGRGIDADGCDPLPVAVVAGDVAVEQPAHEPCLAGAPVDPEILREERADDEAGAVGHPAGGLELAHRGVDERVAGAAGLPGLQRLVVVDPGERAHPGMVLLAGVVGVVEEHVREEVAPRELPHERLRPRSAAPQRPLLDLAGGERAEVQMGGEPGGAVAREVVVVLGVRIEAAGQPARQRPSRGRLARLGRRRTREPVAQAREALTRERFQRRDPAAAHARRQRRHGDGRALHRPARQLPPGAMERREDRERRARARARLVQVVDDERPRPGHGLDAGGGERGGHARVASGRVWRRVVRPVDDLRAGLGRERRQLALRRTGAHDQSAAPRAQLAVQRPQAVEQERGARAGGEASLQDRRVEHEHRDDLLGAPQRRHEGRVVVDPQVAPEPDDCGRGHFSLLYARTGASGSLVHLAHAGADRSRVPAVPA